MVCWTKVDVVQQESAFQYNNATTNVNVEILEEGEIYFFYRPKKDAQEIKGVED